MALPIVGKPVPPLTVARVPLTAALEFRFSWPNTGAFEAFTVKTLYCVPDAVADNALDPEPIKTPLLVNAGTPVPPLATGKVPVVIVEAEIGGKSSATNVVDPVTRPYASVITLL